MELAEVEDWVSSKGSEVVVKGISRIEWSEGGPARFHLIAAQIRGSIRQGTFAPGERLPSEKEMTQVYGWSRGTVRTACGLLEKEGLIRKQQGVGMFVADPSPD